LKTGCECAVPLPARGNGREGSPQVRIASSARTAQPSVSSGYIRRNRPVFVGFLLVIERVFVYDLRMSGALSAAVDELVGRDVSGMCDSEMRETYIGLRRELDRLEAFAAELLAGLHHRGIAAGDGAASAPAWSQVQTGQRWADAKASLDAGLACEALPLTAKAWAQGEISTSAVRMICRGVRAGHEAVYASVEDTMVGFAAARDFRSLDGVIRHYQS